MWCGGLMVSLCGWYPYQWKTYQMVWLVPIGLMILSIRYLDSSVPSLCDSLTKGGSGIFWDVSLFSFLCCVSIIWCPGIKVCGQFVMYGVCIDNNGIRRCIYYPERSDGFQKKLRSWLVGETGGWRELFRWVVDKYILVR